MKSAAIIYHYFPSKEDLFQACLERVTAFDMLRQVLTANQDDPPDVYLRRAGLTYLQLVRDQHLVRLIVVVFSSFQSHPEVPPIALRRIIPSLFVPLLAYLRHQAELATLRPVEPFSAVIQFFGPLVFRVVSASFVSDGSIWPVATVSDEEFVENLVRNFLDGARRRDAVPPAEGHSP